jgi:hypothetical protein
MNMAVVPERQSINGSLIPLPLWRCEGERREKP